MNNNIVVEVSTDKKIIWNLYPLYLHDLSRFNGEGVNTNGVYDFDEIEAYWDSDSMHPMLIRVDGEIAGFIMVTEAPYTKEGTDFCIQEFFIMNKFRRRGFGLGAFSRLLDKFKGIYCLKIMESNLPAYRFWTNNYNTNNIGYEEVLLDDGCYVHIFEKV